MSEATYPVEWTVRIQHRSKSGLLDISYTIKAVIDNQELDSCQSTGAVYWEGARLVGHGHLEMTGYAESLQL
jgi:predicted secreted hydrolase